MLNRKNFQHIITDDIPDIGYFNTMFLFYSEYQRVAKEGGQLLKSSLENPFEIDTY